MQRILVIGAPGAGKSTFARRLGGATGLPVIHLDALFFLPGWLERDRAEFAAMAEAEAARDRWIIDGNYFATMPSRLAAAEALIWLDLPAWRRVPRIVGRIARTHGSVRPDMPDGCPEQVDPGFLLWAAGWRNDFVAKAEATLEASPATLSKHRLRSPPEVEAFVRALEAKAGAAPRPARPRESAEQERRRRFE